MLRTGPHALASSRSLRVLFAPHSHAPAALCRCLALCSRPRSRRSGAPTSGKGICVAFASRVVDQLAVAESHHSVALPSRRPLRLAGFEARVCPEPPWERGTRCCRGVVVSCLGGRRSSPAFRSSRTTVAPPSRGGHVAENGLWRRSLELDGRPDGGQPGGLDRSAVALASAPGVPSGTSEACRRASCDGLLLTSLRHREWEANTPR